MTPDPFSPTQATALREKPTIYDPPETRRQATSRIPTDARDVLFSVNPRAGARSGRPSVDQLADYLRQRDYRVRECGSIDELRAAAAESYESGRLRSVVAAGGDGTVSLVANETPPGVPIAVLPLGTENLLSKYLSIPRRPADIGKIIDQGHTIRLDAGLANQRLFLLMAGVGFDAEVVRRLHASRTGHIRHWSYVKPILDSVRSYEYPPLQVYCDSDQANRNKHSLQGEPSPREQQATGSQRAADDPDALSFRVESRWVFAVNLPRYAGGLKFAPDAVGTDGLLDVCTFRQGSIANGVRYLLGVAFGTHVSWPDCQIIRARRIRITSEASVPYQLDGDPAGHLPLDIQIQPGRLTLLVGERWRRGQPS